MGGSPLRIGIAWTGLYIYPIAWAVRPCTHIVFAQIHRRKFDVADL